MVSGLVFGFGDRWIGRVHGCKLPVSPCLSFRQSFQFADRPQSPLVASVPSLASALLAALDLYSARFSLNLHSVFSLHFLSLL